MITPLFTFHTALLAKAETGSLASQFIQQLTSTQPATSSGPVHAQHRVIDSVGSCTVAWLPSCPPAPHCFIGIDKVLLSLGSPHRYLDKVHLYMVCAAYGVLAANLLSSGDGAFAGVSV